MIETFLKSLRGIFELAFGRVAGVRYFGAKRSDVALSFVALLIALPAELAQKIDGWAMLPESDPVSDSLRYQALVVSALAALVSWLGFLVVSYEVCRLFGKETRWRLFVSCWNWSQVVQSALALTANLPELLGASPVGSEIVLLICLAWAIWFDWRIVRLTLALSVLDAALLVALDALISNVVPDLGEHFNQWLS